MDTNCSREKTGNSPFAMLDRHAGMLLDQNRHTQRATRLMHAQRHGRYSVAESAVPSFIIVPRQPKREAAAHVVVELLLLQRQERHLGVGHQAVLARVEHFTPTISP